MATPHVAGVAALMYEADPTLTPAEVRTILEETATVLDYESWEAGSGYVNAYAAVAVALGAVRLSTSVLIIVAYMKNFTAITLPSRRRCSTWAVWAIACPPERPRRG